MDTTTEQLISDIETAGYNLGRVTGCEYAAELLLAEASRLFANDKDDMAKLVRSLAKTITEKGDSFSKEYDSKYRPERDNAWAVLDKAIGEIKY
jgi:hypothetical protein